MSAFFSGASPADKISVNDAYRACIHFITQLAWRFSSPDLSTLYVEMEIEGGHSVDPALVDEWQQIWGTEGVLSIHKAFKVAGAFLAMERSWTQEEQVRLLLRQLNERPSPPEMLWDLWVDAVRSIRSSCVEHEHERD